MTVRLPRESGGHNTASRINDGDETVMASQLTVINADQLQFTDVTGCRRWLESLPLTNVSVAQQTLSLQVERLRQASIAPAELLHVLETLREPILFVQFELTRKFTGKPLPLDANESAIWARVQLLWMEFADAYLVCRDAHAQGDLRLMNSGAVPGCSV